MPIKGHFDKNGHISFPAIINLPCKWQCQDCYNFRREHVMKYRVPTLIEKIKSLSKALIPALFYYNYCLKLKASVSSVMKKKCFLRWTAHEEWMSAIKIEIVENEPLISFDEG